MSGIHNNRESFNRLYAVDINIMCGDALDISVKSNPEVIIVAADALAHDWPGHQQP